MVCEWEVVAAGLFGEKDSACGRQATVDQLCDMHDRRMRAELARRTHDRPGSGPGGKRWRERVVDAVIGAAAGKGLDFLIDNWDALVEGAQHIINSVALSREAPTAEERAGALVDALHRKQRK